MKLQELAPRRQTAQVSKVFESFFDQRVSFDSLGRDQALKKLRQVRQLVREYRSHPGFHRSEQSPAYLKAVMMEQALATRVMEVDAMPPIGAPAVNPAQQAGLSSAQAGERKKQLQDQIKATDEQIKQLQQQKMSLTQQMNMPTAMESFRRRGRRLTESEVQQAQVVLAAQDMVDKMQGMLEDVSELQFKELPALVDSIKNQVGIDQAAQFNNDATAALSGLMQNLQGTKQQLDQALGVVTGQAQAPAADAMGAADDLGAAADDLSGAADLGGDELDAVGGDEFDAAAMGDEEPAMSPNTLGRAKR
jgi:DNA anti-recombination protein RmuC